MVPKVNTRLKSEVGSACLGVANFGQVGDVPDLYKHFGFDAESIIGSAWDLVDEACR
jgi:transketolase